MLIKHIITHPVALKKKGVYCINMHLTRFRARCPTLEARRLKNKNLHSPTRRGIVGCIGVTM